MNTTNLNSDNIKYLEGIKKTITRKIEKAYPKDNSLFFNIFGKEELTNSKIDGDGGIFISYTNDINNKYKHNTIKDIIVKCLDEYGISIDVKLTGIESLAWAGRHRASERRADFIINIL